MTADRKRSWAWRALQGIALVVVGWFIVRTLRAQQAELAALGRTLHPEWGPLLLSALLVVATYALLVEVWRRLLGTWNAQLPFGAAARIWGLSNLGRYVPGKVWQIGAMGVMARQHGVSSVTAVGASLAIAVLNVLAGVLVAAAAGAGTLGGVTIGWWPLGLALAASLATPWLLPLAVRTAARVTGRDFSAPDLPLGAVVRTLAGCALAWVVYGVAFWFLAQGLLPGGGGSVADAIGIFTGSYLVGYLVLIAPGGIGAREVAMFVALERSGFAQGADATLLVVASRLWLTLSELGPALFLLGWARSLRDAPPPPR
jgi:hypothetical protein